MKKGTIYGKKIKDAYRRFRGAAGQVPDEEPVSPIEQLILAALGQEASIANARKALNALNHDMVDYNELRVSTPAEVSNSIGRIIPRSVQRARTLLRLLNAVYQAEYEVSLENLKGRGVRDIKAYLDALEGMTPYVSASLLLWSLGGHAIPVNEPTLAFLREQDLVHPEAEAAEVQAFLERHISAADAKAFTMDLEAHAAKNGGKPAPRKTKAAPRKTKTTKRTATPKRKTASSASSKRKKRDRAASS